MPDRGLRAVGDDHLVGHGAVREELRLDPLLQQLAGERLAVHRETAVRALGAAQQLARDRDARLRRLLGAANAGELVRALRPSPVVEELLVDGQLDAVRPQRVRDPEREAPGDDRLRDTEPAHDAHRDLVRVRVQVEPAPPQLVGAELLERVDLEPGAEGLDAHRLHRADRDQPLPVDLRVDERIGDPERYLVPELRRANGVAVDEDRRRCHPGAILPRVGRVNARGSRPARAQGAPGSRSPTWPAPAACSGGTSA